MKEAWREFQSRVKNKQVWDVFVRFVSNLTAKRSCKTNSMIESLIEEKCWDVSTMSHGTE